MKQYERILICIDHPGHDARMLAYFRAIARMADSKKIYALHVVERGTDEASDATTGIPRRPEISHEQLHALAEEHFKGPDTNECLCKVVEGPPLIEVLRFAADNDIDLIVIGRQCGRMSDTDNEASLARRVTRKATCSVLVLPEEYDVKADSILVPVRNSECSANALDVACGVADATGGKVIALNVFQVHSGYLRVGTTLEEHQTLLETAAQRECARLVKRVDARGATVTCKCVPDLQDAPVPVIHEQITEEAANLVVIGARGRTGAAGVLLGTVTERLIRESPVPVLAVKKKGECLGIVRALLTLAGEG